MIEECQRYSGGPSRLVGARASARVSVYLDTEFAARIGVTSFGSSAGTYGGGLTAETGHCRIDTLTLGGLTVRDVPAHLLSMRPFSAAARGLQVDGIIGTLLLSRFLATIDHPRGELVLHRRTSAAARDTLQREITEGRAVAMPFWLAGDHVMVTWGRVNDGPAVLLFVDTGLAGAGFVCPTSTLRESGIELADAPGSHGIGGGGAISLRTFVVRELALGPIARQNVDAFFGPFPASLEYAHGFRIAGMVSHDFFRPYALTFDFDRTRIVLTEGLTEAATPRA